MPSCASSTPPRALIFDCDGTLVDSEPWLREALLAEAALHGLPTDMRAALEALQGAPMARQIAILAACCPAPLPADFETRVRARMAELFRAHLQPIPGARELLPALALPFCVASNGPRAKIELVLQLSGLAPWFEGAIFSAYEVGAWKPDPGLFLHAAQAMGWPPAACAVVEDSLSGIRAGLAAGMTVFALDRHGLVLPADVAARVQRIAHLSELPARMAALGN